MIRTMNFLRKLVFYLVALVVAVIALLAGADNSDSVTLKFLEWESMSLPVSAWILMAFVLGIAAGPPAEIRLVHGDDGAKAALVAALTAAVPSARVLVPA